MQRAGQQLGGSCRCGEIDENLEINPCGPKILRLLWSAGKVLMGEKTSKRRS